MPHSDDETQAAPARPPADLDATQAQPSAPAAFGPSGLLPAVPGYEVTHELARGGMGVVYAARDPVLAREVAVKVMHRGQDRDRFVVEARVTAQLPHPGVPPVHALGALPDGRPFLAMKLVRGSTLAAELLTADRVRLLGAFEQVCETVGFAHSRGVVHRDLKPANIMVGGFGEVLVMDWGLAKVLAAGAADDPGATWAGEAAPDATLAGAVKGTPAYMAPEQARGEDVDARADVFALGGILATILTGRAPFAGDTVIDTVARAARAELGPCFALLDGCPADGELVALAKRCLSAEPGDRPATGAEVAAALGAYRAGVEDRLRRAERDRAAAEARAAESANTRREAEARAGAERAKADERRRRRRVQWALAGAVLLLLAAAAAGAGLASLWQTAEGAKDEAQGARDEAERARGAAEVARDQLAGEKRQTEAALAGETAAKGEAEAARRQAETARERLDRLVALRAVDAAYQRFRAGTAYEAGALVEGCPEPLRGWEWMFVARVLDRSCNAELSLPGPGTACTAVAVSPDGRHLGYGFTNGSFGVYDRATGQQIFAVVPKADVALPILSVGFGPDGRTVRANRLGEWIEADFVARTVGRRVARPGLFGAGFFSADGRRQVRQSVTAEAAPVHVWNTSGEKPVRGADLVGHTDRVVGYGAFTADGRRVVTPSADHTARVWDADSGKLLHTLAGHDGLVHAAAFSPDGARVATASLDGTARVWDAATGRPVVTFRGHTAGVVKVAFSPDGRRVLSGSQDQTARLWDAATGHELQVFHTNGIQVDGVAFFPDGSRVVTGSWDRVKVWRVGVNPDGTVLNVPADDRPEANLQRIRAQLVAPTVLAPDGRLAVGGWYENKVRVWDAATAAPVRVLTPFAAQTTAVGVSSDGRFVLAGSYKGEVGAWPVEGGERAAALGGHAGFVRAVVGLPGGRLASASDDGTVKVWDQATGAERWKFTGYKKERAALAATADGKRLAAGVDGGVRVWDLDTGTEGPLLPTKLQWGAMALAFSPDGRLLACGDQGMLVVWDAATGAERFRTGYLWSNIQALAFTPDGTRVATGTFGGAVKLWDVDTGFEALTLRPDCGQVVSLAFSPDGLRLLVGGSRQPVVFGLTPPPPELAPPPRSRDR